VRSLRTWKQIHLLSDWLTAVSVTNEPRAFVLRATVTQVAASFNVRLKGDFSSLFLKTCWQAEKFYAKGENCNARDENSCNMTPPHSFPRWRIVAPDKNRREIFDKSVSRFKNWSAACAISETTAAPRFRETFMTSHTVNDPKCDCRGLHEWIRTWVARAQ